MHNSLAPAVFAAAAKDSTMTSILNLMSQFAIIGGGLWTVWGAIVLGTSLKDHNGPGIQTGVWQCVGGGLIVAAAALFKTIAV